jgi:hypothetical protein
VQHSRLRTLVAPLACAALASLAGLWPAPASAASPFLVLPEPAVVDASPAYRYANMTSEEALAELDSRQILYTKLDAVPGVRAPVRLTGRLHGVYFHSSLPPEERVTSIFEILDARLALALDDFAAVLERHDIDEVVHYTMYRPNMPPPGKAADDGDRHNHKPGAVAAPATKPAAPPEPAMKPEPLAGKKGAAEPAVKPEPHAGKKGTAEPAVKPEPRAGKKAAKPGRHAGKKAAKPEPSLGKKGEADQAKPRGREHAGGAKHKGRAAEAKPGRKVAEPAAAQGPAAAGATAPEKTATPAGKGIPAARPAAKGVAKVSRAGQKPRGKWAPPGTRHPAGLAIDVASLRKRDGTWIRVDRHFDGHIGEKTCGEGARVPEQPEARELRSIVCESLDLGVFTYVLTPNYNTAHADHYHMEIKPGVRWFLVH